MTDTTQAAGLTDDRQIIEMFSEHQRGIAAEFTGTTGVVTLDEAIRVVRAALAAQAVPVGWSIRKTPGKDEIGITSPRSGPGGMFVSAQDRDLSRRMLYALCADLSTASPAPAEAKEEPKRWHTSFAPLGFTDSEKSAWSVGFEQGVGAEAAARATPQPQAAQPAMVNGTLLEPLTEEQEREAFEEWAEGEDFDLSVSWGNKQYTDPATKVAWATWRFRAALRSTQGGE